MTSRLAFLNHRPISKTKSKPFFLIASALLNEKGDLYFKDAFAMPIFSPITLMPVESHYERGCLREIKRILHKFDDLKFSIEKPLFCSFNETNEAFRPDFIITLNDWFTIFIEVLGVENPTYIKHKEIIEKRAVKSCNIYLSIEPYKGYDAQRKFQYQLTQTIHQFLSLHGKQRA